MKKAGLYSLLAASAFYASPFALAAEQQTLEKKVVSEIREIDKRYIVDSLPSSPRLIANNIKEIKRLLEEAQEKKVDVPKEYVRGSDEELLRTKIVLETRSLTWNTMSALLYFKYEQEFTEPILSALRATEEAFGNHPTRYLLIGRQKVLVQLLAGKEPILRNYKESFYVQRLRDTAKSVQFRTLRKGYTVPQNYRSLLDKPIEPWEHYYKISYTRLDEIPRKMKEWVPPEFREEHEQVAKR